MKLTKQDVRSVVDLYIRAWVEQDADLIVTIFTDTATYHERVLEAPIRNREGIRAYWQAKVVESQGRIKCDLLNLYLDGTTAIVEWEAQFDDLPQRVRKRMREVAILAFEDRLIASLREYWSSERIANLCPCSPGPPKKPGSLRIRREAWEEVVAVADCREAGDDQDTGMAVADTTNPEGGDPR